ncbi:replication protein A 70 kDa DNA-binding subunit B [Tanacetum coccineum]
MLENITVHGCCICLWHSYRLNEAHNPYSLDMMLQDSQNSRIQVYIKKEWMFHFEPLFKEGQCYSIFNFAIAENNGRTCNKKANVVESKASSSAGKSKVTFYCEDDGAVQVASRYKVIMRIINSSGSAPIVFFNTIVNKLSGYTAWELMGRHDMDVDEYCPGELLDLVGKRMLFKLYYSDYNANNNNQTYMCDAVSDDPEMIKHFKDGFLDEEMTMRSLYPLNQVKGSNFIDPSLSRILDMHTPTSVNGASGSGGSSGTSSRRLKHTNDNDSDINRVIDIDIPNKENMGSGSGGRSGSKRVFIDLDDI